MGTQYQTIDVTPVAPALGAEISGVDLAAGVSDEQFADIRQAFVDHSVIFLRDQHITPEQHIAFAERWGPININRFFQPVDGYPRIAQVRKEPDQTLNIGRNWHTDHSYDQIPALGSVLYAREVPPIGGDTLFASMYAAHDALSEGMRATLSTMRAEHSSRHAFGKLEDVTAEVQEDVGGRLGNAAAALQDSIHPVIIEHPLSGRPALYVNGDFTLRFEGWTDEESAPLLEYLYRHAVREEFTCRFRWEPGSMAIWDNRATHHRAVNDYQGERRLMHRITIEGDELKPAAPVLAA
jgi:taurine dioxygenase